MLDERLPHFQVDLAYNLMLKRNGCKIFYTPTAEVIHYGSQSVNQLAKKSLRMQHKAFADFSDHYDYFGSSPIIKQLIRWAVALRYWMKLAELKFGKDKRVIRLTSAREVERFLQAR